MIKLLKDIEEIKQEYLWKYKVDPWGIEVFHKDNKVGSFIHSDMVDLFGKEINVRDYECDDDLYHYKQITRSDNGWSFHKDWFVEDFITLGDFEL